VARGVPSGAELAQAVREFLERDVMPHADSRLRFMSRVAANVVASVERELTLGPQYARAHAARLERLGVADDAELCRAIRTGTLDDRLDELRAAVRATAVEKLRIANPRYLRPEDAQ
jgi:Domain of unknown function (DUF6285)